MPNRNIIINEFDVDTPGSDIAEFMELFSPNGGDQSLDGLVIVFYDGLTHKSYYATSLNGYRTESDGYFVLGNSTISAAAKTFANGTLQNGPDAIALYVGSVNDFPNGTAITTTNLLDAVVYGTDDADDPILLSLLNPGQPQINESAGGNPSTQSNQRCSNGSGGQRNTNTFSLNAPNPGAANTCPTPSPTPTSTEAPTTRTLTPTPTPTQTATPSATSQSTSTLTPSPSSTSIPSSATETPTTTPQSTNTATATATPSPTSTSVPNRNIIINEFDVDTPGSDIAEFMELFSPNGGDQSLDGLVIVFYDGLTHKSYYAISLNGYRTESDGYFVLGNSTISAAAKTFANGTLQNGPDAIALYVGSVNDFPNGTAITTTNLLDAVVYGTDDEDDAILLSLLNPAQPQINESAGGSSSTQSNQRCANGSGGQRNTNTFSPNAPNPGATNICPTPSPTPIPTEAPTKVPTATKIATATKTPSPTETAIWLIVPSDTPTPTPDPSQRTQNNSPDDELMRRLVYRHYLMEIHAEDGE